VGQLPIQSVLLELRAQHLARLVALVVTQHLRALLRQTVVVAAAAQPQPGQAGPPDQPAQGAQRMAELVLPELARPAAAVVAVRLTAAMERLGWERAAVRGEFKAVAVQPVARGPTDQRQRLLALLEPPALFPVVAAPVVMCIIRRLDGLAVRVLPVRLSLLTQSQIIHIQPPHQATHAQTARRHGALQMHNGWQLAVRDLYLIGLTAP
jgi:hypothetical protein